ncbi:MAG TPA: phosphate ABC transporter substrate-binding protein [Dissulfurispiraceae bacterium]|nr:phosphate ABC transporter substrate-binding protein [Dissulfurispiraceae bacterium]
MIKKIALCMMAVFLSFGFSAIVEGSEVNGAGVRGVIDVLEPIAPLVKSKVKVTVKLKEEKAGPTIDAVGEKKIDFGMMTRDLNAAEKKKYPNIKAITIAKDGVAIVVHKDNPVKGLTTAQIRDIYAGKITDWSQVGGSKGKIVVNIREKGAGQRVAMESALMGGAAVDEKSSFVHSSMGSMRDDVALNKSAIGYILISAIRDVKAITLDGKAPTIASIKAGAWPMEAPLLLLTPGEPAGATKTFIDFLLSPEGQKAIEKQKVAPVRPTK